MLYAIEWIRSGFESMVGFIERLISNITLASIGEALSGSWVICIPCLIAGLGLCFYGFKCHKLISGLIGGTALGYIGWLIGAAASGTFITVPILYALVLSIVGFSISYIAYPINVLLVSFLFINALCVGAFGILAGDSVWIALLLAIGYCIVYVRFLKGMSALAGAILLGVIAGSLFGAVMGAAACTAAAVAGAATQHAAKKRDDARIAREEEEQISKYPYGPGLRDKQKAARQAQRSARAQEADSAAKMEKGAKA